MLQTSSCKACNAGELVLRKSYKRSRGAVVVGWILAIPGAIGLIVGVLALLASIAAIPYSLHSMRQEARSVMADAHVPSAVIERALVGREMPDGMLEGLTEPQREAVERARRNAHYHGGAGVLGGVMAAAASLVVVLGGAVLAAPAAILLARRQELACTHCGAVSPTSVPQIGGA